MPLKSSLQHVLRMLCGLLRETLRENGQLQVAASQDEQEVARTEHQGELLRMMLGLGVGKRESMMSPHRSSEEGRTGDPREECGRAGSPKAEPGAVLRIVQSLVLCLVQRLRMRIGTGVPSVTPSTRLRTA